MARRIVVVDDNAKFGELIQVFLEQRGYEVLLARDGVAGYQLVHDNRPDLVITDLLLPRMHGFELCKRIKEDPELAATPLILMTAVYKKTSYKMEGKGYGADEFLMKPFELSDLAQSVGRLLPPEEGQKAEQPQSEIEEKIEDLGKTYREQLPERLREIQEMWEALVEVVWDVEQVQDLHRRVHGLIGAAATFGLPAVTDEARGLERALVSLIGADHAPSAQHAAHVRSLVSSLRRTASRATALVRAPRLQHIQAPQPSVRPSSGRRLIYLVDADPAHAGDLARQISLYDFTVRVFDCLDGIKQAVAQDEPAAVVMDMMFPEGELAGARVAADLHQSPDKRVPVVFLSARGDLTARLEAVRAGGCGYFTKPVDIWELVHRLDTLTSHDEPVPFRVLIVEDDQQLATHYALALQHAGMSTQVVTEPADLMKWIADFDPELILMDLYMPGCTGMELAGVLRQQAANISLPIVFLSTETNLDKQVAALGLGGDDFLAKPIEPSRLISSVVARAQRFRDLRSVMAQDSLTGLLTHSKIKEILGVVIARARRNNSTFSFAMLDVDRFKTVNDTYGHHAGDRVLKSLSRLLQERMRKSDVIGRYGGDEFALIFTGSDAASAVAVLDRIRSGFALVRHMAPDGSQFSVTFSAGVAELSGDDDHVSLAAAADKALYQAKNSGRDRVVSGGRG
ncbi:MAG: response regulator [Acidobacteriota bacterium]